MVAAINFYANNFKCEKLL